MSVEGVQAVVQTCEKRSVLVIDDDRDFAESVNEILSSHGYDCAVASGVQEALAAVPEFDAHVALVDVRLGTENGLKVISDLRRTQPAMHYVVMSAYADLESAMEALREGVHAYLRKPVDVAELLATLETCFEKIRLRRDELAAQGALRMASAKLEEKNRRLADLAATDELTGLYNRRQFIDMLRRECRRGKRHGTSTALVVADIDHFKAINDTYGHTLGDRVLVEVSRTLKEGARETDVVGRYGGDEFMILMPVTDDGSALAGAERLRKKVQQIQGIVLPADVENPYASCSLRVSISLGVGSLSADEDGTPEQLIERADASLYIAKTSGRNCTRTWQQIHYGPAVPAASGLEQEAIEQLHHRLNALSGLYKEAFIRSTEFIATAQESHDPFGHRHSENVMRYADGIAETMGLDPGEVEVIHRAAMLHDIGSVGIPDRIVQKPGPLTPQERRIVQQHVLIGTQLLDQLRFLGPEIAIIRHHHERWDGTGYPDGIAGDEIPLGAQVLAVADAFHAITSDRAYRRASDWSKAIEILVEASGRQFSPAVVDALCQWVREPSRNSALMYTSRSVAR